MALISKTYKGKNTFYVQMSFRNKDGKVSSKIVEKLGDTETLMSRFGKSSPDEAIEEAKEYAKRKIKESSPAYLLRSYMRRDTSQSNRVVCVRGGSVCIIAECYENWNKWDSLFKEVFGQTYDTNAILNHICKCVIGEDTAFIGADADVLFNTSVLPELKSKKGECISSDDREGEPVVYNIVLNPSRSNTNCLVEFKNHIPSSYKRPSDENLKCNDSQIFCTGDLIGLPNDNYTGKYVIVRPTFLKTELEILNGCLSGTKWYRPGAQDTDGKALIDLIIKYGGNGKYINQFEDKGFAVFSNGNIRIVHTNLEWKKAMDIFDEYQEISEFVSCLRFWGNDRENEESLNAKSFLVFAALSVCSDIAKRITVDCSRVELLRRIRQLMFINPPGRKKLFIPISRGVDVISNNLEFWYLRQNGEVLSGQDIRDMSKPQ